MNKQNKMLSVIAVLLVFIIVGLSVFLVVSLKNDIGEYTEVNDTQTKIIDTVVRETEDDFSVDWNNLLSINKKVVGWIRIPDTEINYPVIQGDTNSQYIRTNIYGEYSRGGTLFVDCNIEKPFNCVNTVIYGHNLHNGAMFSKIKNYADNDFYKTHRTIYIYLPDNSVKEYEVVSFHIVDARNVNVFNPYVDDAEEYGKCIFTNNKVDNGGAEICSNDEILTLSTCTNGKEYDRYVVHAVWINRG